MNKETHHQDMQESNITEVIESLNDGTSVSAKSNRDSEDISNLMNDIFLNANDNHSNELNCLGSIFHAKNELLNKEVAIRNSENVKVGDITIFQGPVNFIETKYKVHKNKNKAEGSKSKENELFKEKFVNRITWLAQSPLGQYEVIKEPVPLVVICHTGTDIVRTQSENKYIIRYIQCYHIESERWNDISYNFLIGADGYIYEGRGWGVVGRHTDNFNEKSVGIAFVGTYKEELPPQESLEALKILIETGIQKQYISPKYSLECQNNLVPSKYHENRLIDITKTWQYFSEST